MGGVTAVQAEYIQTELCGRGMSNVWADRVPTSSSAMTSRRRKTLRVPAAVVVTAPPVERSGSKALHTQTQTRDGRIGADAGQAI
jgi:hypothetical protein